jgi:dTMP kinase
MRAPKGLFITLEGPEGSGKSLQASALAEGLKDQGYSVTLTREPGGTTLGERIRELLLTDQIGVITPEAEALLFSASRAQLAAEIIRPSLEAGDIVVCDRYTDSTLAYQGYGRGLSLEGLRSLLAFATGGLLPDLTFYLDLPVEVGLERRCNMGKQPNRLDREEIGFHRRVRNGFLKLAKERGRWVTIDATQTPETVREAIRRAVAERLPFRLTEERKGANP